MGCDNHERFCRALGSLAPECLFEVARSRVKANTHSCSAAASRDLRGSGLLFHQTLRDSCTDAARNSRNGETGTKGILTARVSGCMCFFFVVCFLKRTRHSHVHLLVK